MVQLLRQLLAAPAHLHIHGIRVAALQPLSPVRQVFTPLLFAMLISALLLRQLRSHSPLLLYPLPPHRLLSSVLHRVLLLSPRRVVMPVATHISGARVPALRLLYQVLLRVPTP